MNIVVDTNVFIAALIKDSTSREIVVNSDYNFLFPEFELKEVEAHKQEVIKKSGLTEKEFDILLLRLLRHVRIIPAYITFSYKEEAQNLMQDIDSDDAIFIATALTFNCPIWSDDRHFQKQKKIKILTTKDMINMTK